MKEFISLEEELYEVKPLKKPTVVETLISVEKPKKVFESVKQDDVIILEDKSLLDQYDLSPEQFLENIDEEMSLVHCDDASTTYGDFDPEGYFKRDNLFSEISDDYARMQARINLGIAEAYAMKWGNINGNIIHQKDLYDFVMDNIHMNIQDLINALNTHLTKWAIDIQNQINTKADINSPSFTGIPTTPTPINSSNSNQIANTAWVTSKIYDLVYQDLKYFTVTPDTISWDDLPVTVVLRWEFLNPISSLTINGVSMNIDTQTYSIVVNTNTTIEFNYTLPNGVLRKKDVFIEVLVPVYVGHDLTNLTPFITPIIEYSVPKNEYLYLLSEILEFNISVNGIEGGFSNTGITHLKGKQFYVFKSLNKDLGSLKLRIV